jgi:large subunit ribosomal protein L37Ae
MSTKKVKSAGKFGARYGLSIKRRWLKVDVEQKKKHLCPECGFPKVKRLSRGKFKCLKCKSIFAGGAFVPKTLSGAIIDKMVSQKSFAGSLGELIQASEQVKGQADEESVAEVEKPIEHKKKKAKKVEEAVEPVAEEGEA